MPRFVSRVENVLKREWERMTSRLLILWIVRRGSGCVTLKSEFDFIFWHNRFNRRPTPRKKSTQISPQTVNRLHIAFWLIAMQRVAFVCLSVTVCQRVVLRIALGIESVRVTFDSLFRVRRCFWLLHLQFTILYSRNTKFNRFGFLRLQFHCNPFTSPFS